MIRICPNILNDARGLPKREMERNDINRILLFFIASTNSGLGDFIMAVKFAKLPTTEATPATNIIIKNNKNFSDEAMLSRDL